MAEIRVTSGELKNKVAELRQLNAQFKKAVEDMSASEQQLTGMWDGDAKENFHNAYSSDRAQMDIFYDTIEKYCQTLESNAAGYEAAEAKNANMASARAYR